MEPTTSDESSLELFLRGAFETVRQPRIDTGALETRLKLIAELLAAAPADYKPPALVFRHPNGEVKALEIIAQFTLGRATDATLSFPDRREMSRRQLEIHSHPDSHILKDTGSANGTQVNGKLIKQHELIDGDLIEAGGLTFLFVRGEQTLSIVG